MEQETTQEMVTITKAEYNRLLDNEFWLECLDVAGVDNWDGYGTALTNQWCVSIVGCNISTPPRNSVLMLTNDCAMESPFIFRGKQ